MTVAAAETNPHFKVPPAPPQGWDLLPFPEPARGAMMRVMSQAISRLGELCERGEQTCW